MIFMIEICASDARGATGAGRQGGTRSAGARGNEASEASKGEAARPAPPHDHDHDHSARPRKTHGRSVARAVPHVLADEGAAPEELAAAARADDRFPFVARAGACSRARERVAGRTHLALHLLAHVLLDDLLLVQDLDRHPVARLGVHRVPDPATARDDHNTQPA